MCVEKLTQTQEKVLRTDSMEEKIHRRKELDLPGHRKCKLPRTLVLVLVFVDLYMLVRVILVINALTQMKLELTWNRKFSVLCDDVSLSVTEDLRMTKDVVTITADESGRHICTFDNLTYVADKATERVSRMRRAKGKTNPYVLSCGNRDFAEDKSLYVAYFRQIKNITGSGFNHVIDWSDEKSRSRVGQSFRYNGGFLRVNTTSIFFVSLTLRIKKGRRFELRKVPFLVSVCRREGLYKNWFPLPLIESVEPSCDSSCNGTTTVHLGSHVFLHKNDDVFVRVSDPARVDFESRGNTFGIFKVE